MGGHKFKARGGARLWGQPIRRGKAREYQNPQHLLTINTDVDNGIIAGIYLLLENHKLIETFVSGTREDNDVVEGGVLRVVSDTFTGQYGTGEWLMVRGTSTINNQPFSRTRWLRYKMSTPAMT